MRKKKVILLAGILLIISYWLFQKLSPKPDIVPAQVADFCSKIHNTDTIKLSEVLLPFETRMLFRKRLRKYSAEKNGLFLNLCDCLFKTNCKWSFKRDE